MEGGHLRIITEDLSNVGGSIAGISEEVDGIFKKMDAAVHAVTSSDAWSGAASNAFLGKFEECKRLINSDLQQLAALGPTIQQVANTYARAEEENVARAS